MRSLTLRITAFAVASAFVPALIAQGPPQRDAQERQPPIRVQANYVRVDVFPTVDGRPVMDLRAEEFEVLEDGRPQEVDAFEHVVITGAGPQAQRPEPNTIEASRQLAASPRSRVFVVFLDAPHTTIEGTWNIREPLIRLIDRVLGPDDLIGIMTPEMAPQDVTLARKTEAVENGLRKGWPWGYRHSAKQDPRDWDYQTCYPPTEAERLQRKTVSDLAREMIARRRERMSLEALNDLVRYLRHVREERKAILTVTEGWLLYRPNSDLVKLRQDGPIQEAIPGRDPVGIGRGGKITLGNPNDPTWTTKASCDVDRLRLSQVDDDDYFRRIIDEANRANASFYTIDPRGLAVFDTPIGPEPPLSIPIDAAHLRARLESIRTLAHTTDGIAVAGNDLNAGLKRIADDLTSYYLLGYYTSNTKLDGTFRRITVRLKRPGVQVRARRGYRAATEEEVASARAASDAPVTAEAAAVANAMEVLARIRPEARFRLHATPWSDSGEGASMVWVAGELQPFAAADPWTRGGTADIDVAAGAVTATARVTLAAGQRAFLIAIPLPRPVTEPLVVRGRLAGTDPDAARLADSVHVPVIAGTRQPLLFRRGPTTGNRQQPAATFLFSRTERVRVEIPAPLDAKPGAARLLDRTGQPLPVPLTVGERTDADTGRHWITLDLTLAPLGAGDYAIEVTSTAKAGEHKTVTAIRVVR